MRAHFVGFFLQFCLFFAWAFSAEAVVVYEGMSEGERYKVECLLKGRGVVWGMDFLNSQQMILTERGGDAYLFDIKAGDLLEVLGEPTVLAKGQGGLLDVAVSPNFNKDGRIYFTYSKPQQGQGVTTLAWAKLNGRELVELEDLLVTKSATSTSRHFGSRITFGGQGHVFFGVGDRGERDNAQNLEVHAGSILRLNLDGSVPSDNPFINVKGALPEIWSYGHRNPQGLVFDKISGLLWEIEHGPRGGDELNLISKGQNYGWAVVSLGKEYWGPVAVGEDTHRKGMVDPEKVYIPSIAPSSLMIYSGAAFPHWRGDLFAGALALQHLNRIKLDKENKVEGEERLLESLRYRVRALRESADGWIYFSTDTGEVCRIVN